jgi:hypothetical protein
MLRLFVANLLTVLLLAHAVLGCCKGAALWRTGSNSAVAALDCCCRGCQRNQKPHRSNGQSDCRLECQRLCIYLSQEHTGEVEYGSQHVDLLPPLLEQPLPLPFAALDPSADGGARGVAPPVRLHLLQRKLIV